MKPPENKVSPDPNIGFFFLGNQLTLDLLNTRPQPHGESVELLTDFRALLKWFEAAKLLTAADAALLQARWAGSDRAPRIVKAIQRLREKLRREVLRWETGGMLGHGITAELNDLLARHPMQKRLRPAPGGAVKAETWFAARQPEDLLAPLAQGALELFTGADRNRVRKCAHCVLHFYDTSKKGTRRWCSMQLCGNRFKVAAYAERERRAQSKKGPIATSVDN